MRITSARRILVFEDDDCFAYDGDACDAAECRKLSEAVKRGSAHLEFMEDAAYAWRPWRPYSHRLRTADGPEYLVTIKEVR